MKNFLQRLVGAALILGLIGAFVVTFPTTALVLVVLSMLVSFSSHREDKKRAAARAKHLPQYEFWHNGRQMWRMGKETKEAAIERELNCRSLSDE